MKPVKLMISRKTVIPSKTPKYNYHIAFLVVDKIDYSESEYIFKDIGDRDVGVKIEKDSQFAKWLVDNYGFGRYLISIWRKGFWGISHYYFDCTKPNRFRQIPKKKTKEREEIEKGYKEMKKYYKELKEEKDKERRKELVNKIEEIKEDLEINNEVIRSVERGKRKIILFKNTLPLYKEHEYEDYGDVSNNKIEIKKSIW